jgi:GNAT superfamily N-acetyltransferase
MNAIELRRVEAPPDWRACHNIRRAVLYEARGRLDYDEDYPDNLVATNHTLALVVDGVVTGVSRLDFHRGHAILRAVAIDRAKQRQGFGRDMIMRAEAYALAHGAGTLFVNSAPDATDFYERLGYRFAPPNEEPNNPCMTKVLTTP